MKKRLPGGKTVLARLASLASAAAGAPIPSSGAQSFAHPDRKLPRELSPSKPHLFERTRQLPFPFGLADLGLPNTAAFLLKHAVGRQLGRELRKLRG